MKIPTDLPQSRDPPERDVQRPAATATTTESSQTPHEEARDILAKALRNQAEDGPSTRRAAIRAYKYLYALVQQHGPQLQKV
jgi:plasmid stability protein